MLQLRERLFITATFNFFSLQFVDAQKTSNLYIDHMIRTLMLIYGAIRTFLANDPHDIYACRKVRVCQNTLSKHWSEFYFTETAVDGIEKQLFSKQTTNKKRLFFDSTEFAANANYLVKVSQYSHEQLIQSIKPGAVDKFVIAWQSVVQLKKQSPTLFYARKWKRHQMVLHWLVK